MFICVSLSIVANWVGVVGCLNFFKKPGGIIYICDTLPIIVVTCSVELVHVLLVSARVGLVRRVSTLPKHIEELWKRSAESRSSLSSPVRDKRTTNSELSARRQGWLYFPWYMKSLHEQDCTPQNKIGREHV